jgi:peptidoglycan/xylan/chitin deacetylase (PgdA/CDA1 family)
VIDASGTVQYAQVGVVRSDVIVQAVQTEPENTPRDVYLTFDDFPAKNGDAELLDILRREKIGATFFCIGTNLERQPKLGKRAISEGHSLQMHGWRHDADNPELPKLAALVKRLGGAEPHLYRPPGSKSVRGLSNVPAVVDPYDYQQPNRTELLRRILSAVRHGSILQLHAGVPITRLVLPELIQTLRQRGYRFRLLR